MDSINDRDPECNGFLANDYMGRDMDRHYEDDELDALERAATDEQAERAMADADDLADLREAARVQRERADAEMAEADRLESLMMTTEARLAAGAVASVQAVCDIFTRRAV
jgi:hypothetical protein